MVVVAIPSTSAMRTAGAMNCQAETPAARATTSSSRRDRFKKQNMAATRTANGSTRSVMNGTR